MRLGLSSQAEQEGRYENSSSMELLGRNVTEAFEALRLDEEGKEQLSLEDFKKQTLTVYEGVQKALEGSSQMVCYDEKEIAFLYEYFLKSGENLIVRREDPEKIYNLITKNSSIEVGNNMLGFSRYPNSALFGGAHGDISGLDNAFTEGQLSAGGVVTTIGFHKNDERMTVLELPEEDVERNGKRRDKARSFGGTIKPEDIAFIIVRMPNSLMPGKEKSDGFYSFSGYVFNEDKEKLREFFEKKIEASYKKAS